MLKQILEFKGIYMDFIVAAWMLCVGGLLPTQVYKALVTVESRDTGKSACTFPIIGRWSGGQRTRLFQTSDQLKKVDVSKSNEGSTHIH
jgi:hypothetical protein